MANIREGESIAIQSKNGNCEDISLSFVPFSSLIGSGFWHKFSEIVLNKIGLSRETISIHGYYTRSVAPSLFTVEYSSFSTSPQISRETVITSGLVVNTNTVEEFRDIDKNELIKTHGQKLIALLSTPEGLETIAKEPHHLVPFFILTYANLKNYFYKFWFAFPGISAIKLYVLPKDSTDEFAPEEQVSQAVKTKHELITSGFFVINYNDSAVEIECLKSGVIGEGKIYGFLDTSSVESHPSWALRNFVAFIIRANNYKSGDTVKIAGVRLPKNKFELRVYSLRLEFPPDFLENPKFVGWERNSNGKLSAQAVDLKSSMDPAVLCESSVDFNLKLMKWRLFQSFDLEKLHNTKCLLLGAGTLGCNVARCLMAWGIRHIKFIDNSTVNYSNPVRQSLFTFQDCVEGKGKAVAAAESLKKIYPGVNATGERILVPMPGHPVSPATLDQVTKDFKILEGCVNECDVLFLLMDTREARWLPSVMGAAGNKIIINAALGFDSYVVMRHGDTENNLGCYFCTDVVAPGNSTRDRTLDQQCTVTRPGISYIASALAVELLVSFLHRNSENPLGTAPHSIRGFLSAGEILMPSFGAFDKCTACSSSIKKEYQERNLAFVLDVMNDSNYLERITGLDKLKEEDLMDGIIEINDDEFSD